MALKGDRDIKQTEISFVCNDVHEQGVILMYNNVGSGAALGDTAGTVTLAASPSGMVPAGLSLSDMVSIDTTKYHRNFQKPSQQLVGENVNLLRKGWVVTNKVTGTPVIGPAYVTANGIVTPTIVNIVATPKVGEFMGKIDQDGYVKLAIELPA